MKIRRNKLVYLDMTVLDEQGAVIESTDGRPAFCYLHGRGNLLPALEAVLQGRLPGFATRITLPPEQAFGPRHADLTVQASRANFSAAVHLRPGEFVQMPGPNGTFAMRIEAVADDHVRLDANHPYAGKTLTFLLKVLQVRDAHKDEVRHRQPHPGGHHLMVADSSW